MPKSSNPCWPLHAKCGTKSMKEFTSANLGEADLMVYLCHDTHSGDGTRGTAAISVACNNEWWAPPRRCSINEYQESKALFAEVSSLLSMTNDMDTVI